LIDDLPSSRRFEWHDAERVVLFGEGKLANSVEGLASQGWSSYEMLTTERALGAAPLSLPDGSECFHYVPNGQVTTVAAGLVEQVESPNIVAFGGGRVIDVAKAIAAVTGGRVAAIPTTLSGAEMTRIHRLPEGHSASELVRPALVIADPEAMTGLPDDQLRASAMNALGHGAEPLYTPLANPVASLAALRGAEQIAHGIEKKDRSALALGSILCAYALDSAGYALHHVVCQTLVRVLGTPHAETNATMIPHTLRLMQARAPEAMAALAKALGTNKPNFQKKLIKLGGGPRRLGDYAPDASRKDITEAIEAMAARDQLALTPGGPVSQSELRELVEKAW
jgi:alcohol dehydrogenase class IV